jgi:DNA polymerase (family 10)
VPIGDDERALYDLLGMSFVIPEMREDTGEVDAALEKRLHVPLEMNDIRCDLHCHTFWSDGTASVDEMAQAAKTRGYTHLGIADHSRSLVVAHGLTLNEIRAQIREIWEWNAKNADSGFCLLAGTECDILGDGTLDWPMDLLSELDCVVASVHTRFKMEEKEMTERVVRALETGRIHVLGHPTGQLLSGRDPYALNMPLVLETARRTGTCVEINAHPDRLDLSDTHARMAKEMGVRLAINSDAHSPEGFGVMEYGVHCARRGWLSAEDVVNTYPLDRLMRVLRKEE